MSIATVKLRRAAGLQVSPTSSALVGLRVRRSRVGRLGLMLGLVVVLVLLAGWLSPADPNAVSIQEKFVGPTLAHPLGTDAFGRDQLARLAAGGRSSLSAAVLVLLISMGLALIVGVASGMIGGWIDAVLMRINDVLLSIPSIVLAMAVIGVLGPGFLQLVGALTVAYVATFTRMARAFTVSCRRRDDVTAARLSGIPWWRTVSAHIVPGVASHLWVVSTLTLGDIVISIAGLSFLGLGIQPPAAEWGAMLAESQSAFLVAPWLLIAPATAILLTAASVNLIADALREGERS